MRGILCNRQTAHKNLQKILGKKFRLPIIVLPSTSPAYAGLSYFDKLKSWYIILEKLQ